MEPSGTGQLVTVTGAGPDLDGIVFDAPSRTKVVVAVIDPGRGPVFRTVHPDALSERETESAHDPVLRSLVRRTPPPTRGGARAGSTSRKGSAGFTRGASHRPTGK